MYEGKDKPLLQRHAFRKRMVQHCALAALLFSLTLAVGVIGHIHFDGMSFATALIASLTLFSGLGLSVLPESTSGQLFAGLYGILSNYIYIATSGIIIAPLLHRILHKFHIGE